MLLVAAQLLLLTLTVPPQVVSTTPARNDLAVDPNIKQIVIVFDQDMNTGGSRSICGGGDRFPELVGQPRWTDKRTFVWNVKLKPDHEYYFSANCPSAGNFRNAAGESAIPYAVPFHTAPAAEQGDGGASPDEDKLTPEINDAAIDTLRDLIQHRYSYRDRLGLDWDTLFEQYAPQLRAATTPRHFIAPLVALLGQAKDKHVKIRLGDELLPTYISQVRPNANDTLLRRTVPHWRELSPGVYAGQFDDGIGYLRIDSWNNQMPVGVYHWLLETLHPENDRAKSLIIDVRFNGGGDEPTAQLVAGRFIDDPVVYAQHVSIDPDAPDGFTSVRQRTLQPVSFGAPGRFYGKVAVLTGPVTMSSCEAFVLMMKQAPDATIIGDTTQGSSGNPRSYDLGNGVAVSLPSWKSMDMSGRELEGVGIEPDIKVSATPADFNNADPVLDAALEHLRK